MAEIIKAHQKIKTDHFNQSYKDSYDKKYYSDLWDVLDMVNRCKGGINHNSEIINRYDYEIEISVTYIKKDWTKE